VNGVLLGAGMSIVLLVRQAAKPRVRELTPVPGTTYFADRSRQPDQERVPGVLVVRCESALLYFNIEYVRHRLHDLLQARTDPVRLVVFYLGSVPNIDLAGAELLVELHRILRARGIEFQLAEAHGAVRDALQSIGFEREYGPLSSAEPIDAVIKRWQASSEGKPQPTR
jgi:MFS superfamily sulfate permease-like transporter